LSPDGVDVVNGGGDELGVVPRGPMGDAFNGGTFVDDVAGPTDGDADVLPFLRRPDKLCPLPNLEKYDPLDESLLSFDGVVVVDGADAHDDAPSTSAATTAAAAFSNATCLLAITSSWLKGRRKEARWLLGVKGREEVPSSSSFRIANADPPGTDGAATLVSSL
jgi:hypothetical protein